MDKQKQKNERDNYMIFNRYNETIIWELEDIEGLSNERHNFNIIKIMSDTVFMAE